MYYSSFAALAIIITLIINHNVMRASKKANDAASKIIYKRFLMSVLVYYISDLLWGLLYGWNLTALTYADTIIYFVAMVVSLLLWTRYVVEYLGNNNLFSRVLKYVGWAILLYAIVTLALNFLYPIVFCFDESGVYHPGSARYVTLGIQIALFLTTSAYSLAVAAKSKGKARRHHRTIGFSGIVMVVFVILQTLFPLFPFYAVGCLITTCLIHAFIIEDERRAYTRELGSAKHKAYTDSLTGVKNPHAYAEEKAEIDRRIDAGELNEFAVVIFDLNGLKTVNDTEGHDAGDRYIESACRLICDQFKRSPVYRIGGDEFVAFLTGEDYRHREELLADFDKKVEANQEQGLVVVSSGMSDYIPGSDNDYNTIFERADRIMYERKRKLKERALTLA
ncbi:MAG: diguanylate cyclase [Clostridia bacterium]|nr:diguanylate cyclase [Clostridia bacterium]